MYVLGRLATYATQVLFSLFVANSALPTTFQDLEQTTDLPINATLGLDNETIVRLPNGIPWSPEISTFQASVPYPVPDTAITLSFTHFGFQIPVVRALSTIYDARRQVLSHLASNSEDATKNHLFEYSTRSNPPEPRVCSVVVQDYGGHGLSWLQLDQILEGLIQFSSGAGIDRQVHYQALEFEVDLSDEGRIGTGLLWCAPGRGRGVAEVKERAEIQELDKRMHLVSVLANETSSPLSNASSLLSSSAASVSFPVPDTNISLAFVWLGNPIPSKMINEALNGAFSKTAPFLKRSGSKQIPHDRFFYWTPAGKVRVLIQIYGMIKMNWSQVNSIIADLFRFTNGIGTIHQQEHFENLGFDVKDEDGRNIGYGNLLAIPVYGSDAVSAVDEKRSSLTPPPINSTNLQLYNANTSSHSVSTRYIWPIPNTDFTLVFTYMGSPLPAGEVNAVIRDARKRIKAVIRAIPDLPIDRGGFSNHVGTVEVSVTAYEGAEISWWQLGEVLTGLADFCVASYKRLLVFDIDVENHGPIGVGKLWYYSPPNAPEVAKRATNPAPLQMGLVAATGLNTTNPTSLAPNTTLSPASFANLPVQIPYPVPYTTTTLLFYFIGHSIPPTLITNAITKAIQQIGFLAAGPERNDPISDEVYQCKDASGTVAVTVFAYTGHVVTWKQLDNVLFGLHEFTTNSQGGLAGEHFQVLGFKIYEGGRGEVGLGTLSYYPEGVGERGVI